MKLNLHYLYIQIIFIFILSQPTLAEQFELPDIGDSNAAVLTPTQERRTGETVMRNLRRNHFIVDDPLLMSYINDLGYRLLSHYDGELNHQFYFFIVKDGDLNAFALPGGFVGINYGLIIRTENESELASVMAHEIAHVTQRHYARAYDVDADSELPILAAIVAMIALGGSGDSGDLGQALIATSVAANAQKRINFTRHNEEEADRIGISLLYKANFNTLSMATFFEKMDKESRLHGSSVPEFLRTHPVTVNRISDARNRASQFDRISTDNELSFHLMRYRIIVLASHDIEHTLAFFENEIKNTVGAQNTAAKYGYALISLSAEKYTQANTTLKKLIKNDPNRIAYILAYADLAMAQGNNKQAIQLYEDALKLYPNNEALTHDYIILLLEQKSYSKSEKILQSIIKTKPYNPIFYKHLAMTRAKLGFPGRSHEAMVEYYYQIGQFHQALEQIELALEIKDLDFYTSSRLEARRLEIQEEIPKNKL